MVQDRTALLQEYIFLKIAYLTDPCISDLMSLNNGWECDVYSFVLRYTDNGLACERKMILRAYTGKDVPLFPNKPLHEFNVLRQLCSDGYPVPEVYLLECDSCYLGSPFVIMELIEGEGLDQVFYRSNDVERGALLKLGAELFVALHDLDYKPYMGEGACEEDNAILHELNRHREIADHFGANYALPGLDWLRQQAGAIAPGRLALAHWDYHFGNIILTPDKQPVVIDWTISAVTDYRFDLAWSLLFLGDAAEGFVALYEEASGEKVEHLEFFLAFACLRRLLTMLISLEHGAEVLGMRPLAENIIRKHKVHMHGLYSKWLGLSKMPIPYVESVIAGL
ncbi:MAG: phosphotransferase [Bacillota bacterium]|nr:phosphotransferase [Bacillota bacterium]